jgi:hypothetical protein
MQFVTVQLVAWEPQFIIGFGAAEVVAMEACASRIFPSAKALSDIPLIVTAAKRTAKPRITASTARKRDRLW